MDTSTRTGFNDPVFTEPRKPRDITRPWRFKFLECKDVHNRGAPSKIWDPPTHGLPIKQQAGRKGRRK